MKIQPRQRELLLFAAACLLEISVLGALAIQRSINADEGFYVVAGLRVLDGRVLYRDFFFPQMPYLPYAEAVAMAFTGPSLLAMRWVGVLLGSLVAGLLAVIVARQAKSPLAGMLVALAYAGHSLILSYLSIVKTYGLANLGLVLAFALVVLPRKPRRLAGFVAGLAAGLAVGTRLPALAAVVVLALWSWRRGPRVLAAFCAALVLASLPWLWTAIESPQHFWFCNFGFHLMRGQVDASGPVLAQKLIVVAKWLFLPQNALLWMGAVGGFLVAPAWSVPAIACVGALSVAYLAATPTYLDYMVQIIPFLLIASAPVIPKLMAKPAVLALVIVLYAGGFVGARRAAPEDSLRAEKARLWDADAVQTVASYLRDSSSPDDRILSWWEGYPFLAGRDGYVGVGFWESNLSHKLTPEQRQRYHILHRDDLERLLVAGDPRLVVFPKGVWEDLQEVLGQHYDLAQEFGVVRVFSRRSDAT